MKVALLSDIHANHKALEIVLEDLNKENVTAIIVAGDLVGYYYWPHKVIDIIMNDKRFYCIQGNHDRMLKRALKNDSFMKECREKYGSGYDICKKMLKKKHLDWLFALPENLSLSFEKKSIFVTHSSLLNDDSDYIYPSSSLDVLLSNYSDKDFTIFGHSHYPLIHSHNGKYLINPGSVGQPRDLAGIASYVILYLKSGLVQFKRKPFNIDSILKEAEKIDPEFPYLQTVLQRK